MGGLFSDSQTSNTSSNGTSTGTSIGNLFADPRMQGAYDTFASTFNPAAVAASGAVTPLQTQAGTAQGQVAGQLAPVQSQALNIGNTGISPAAIEAYRNQYAQMAIDPTISAFDTLRKNSISSLHGDAASQGALGNSNNAQAEAIWDANNQPGIRRDIANLENQGYMTAANTAAQSTGYQLSGLGAATSANQAETGANQVASNIGEQARLAGLTPFDEAAAGLKNQAVPGLLAGNTSQTVTAGNSATSGTQTPSIGSTILGGLGAALSFARDGGAITDEDRPGYFDGGDIFGGGGWDGGAGSEGGGWESPGLFGASETYEPAMDGTFSGGYGDGSLMGGGYGGKDDLSQAAPHPEQGAAVSADQQYAGKGWPSSQPTESDRFVPPPRDPNAAPPVAAKDPNWTATVKKEGDPNAAAARRAAEMMQKSMQPKKEPPKENANDRLAREAQERRATNDQLMGQMSSGLASAGRAHGGAVPIHQKVEDAYALFDRLKNGGAAGGGGEMPSPPGFAGGGREVDPPIDEQAAPAPDVGYDAESSPFSNFVPRKGGELAMPAITGEGGFPTPPPNPRLTTGSVAPPPAPSPAARGAPPPPEASGVRGFLGKVLPGLNEGVWAGKGPTPTQRLGMALTQIKSPRWNAPFSGMGEQMNKFLEFHQQDLDREQKAGELTGQLTDGRQTLAGARNPAVIKQLEAQSAEGQIRVKGIEQSNQLYAQQLKNIDGMQWSDERGFTAEGQRGYDAMRLQAKAKLDAEIERYNAMGGAGGGGGGGGGESQPQRVAPGAPKPSMPQKRWNPFSSQPNGGIQ